jgi:predicted permease
MGQKLAKLFLYAVVALLLGIAGLWLIVSRFLRTPDQISQIVRPRVATEASGSSDADATLGVDE